MFKGLILIQNKDERAMGRTALSSLRSLAMISNLKDGLEELKKVRGAVDLLVIDERFDQSSDARNENLKVLDILEYFGRAEARPVNAVTVVILNESSPMEAPVGYAESGVDLFLRRPFGAQELRDKISESVEWIASPPPLVKLIRIFQEHFKRGQYAEMVGGLESLYDKNSTNLRVGMLLARVLMKQGGDSLKRGIEIAQSLDGRYPESLFAKRLLIEGYRALGIPADALKFALRLFALSSTDDSFSLCIDLAELRFRDDPLDFSSWHDLFEVLAKQVPALSRERRLRVIRFVTERNPDTGSIEKFVRSLEKGHEDILSEIKDCLVKWLDRVELEHEDLTLRILRILLEVEPGQPDAIERYTDLQIKTKNYKAAEKQLLRARKDNNLSVSFYSAFVKLSLAQNMLKEASDMLHAGRRLAPSDDRWEVYSKMWSDKYARKEVEEEASTSDEVVDVKFDLAELEARLYGNTAQSEKKEENE